MHSPFHTTFFPPDSSASVTLLTGAAGTGKTTLVKQIVESLTAAGIPCVLLAPTGRAAKVLRERTGHDAQTIHRHIYETDALPERTDAHGNNNTFKWVFKLKVNPDGARTVYIVDEASMVSDTFSEEERFRFGSGHLLSDLMEFIDMKATNNERRLLVVGDPCQLLPVNSPNSPALSVDYLQGKFDVKVSEHNLRTVHRQRGEGGILKNAMALRDAIEARRYTSFGIEAADDVTPESADSFLAKYLQATEGRASGRTVVVTHSNRLALTYNQLIRAHLFRGHPSVRAGDLLQVVKNKYHRSKPDLMNGDFIHVLEVSDAVETLSAPLGNERPTVYLQFRRAKIRPASEDWPMDVMLLDNLLGAEEPGLSEDQQDALYVNFKLRHPRLKPNTDEFTESYRCDPYVNAVRVKYGYAMTCHRAQGGEWDTVFVDYRYSGSRTEDFFRWAYTATTRAKGKLFTLNVESFSPLTLRRPVDSSRQLVVVAPLASDAEQGNTTTDLAAETSNSGKSAKDEPILAAFRDAGVLVSMTTEHPHHYVYRLQDGTLRAQVRIFHNAEGVITKFTVDHACDGGFGQRLATILAALPGKRIGLAGNHPPPAPPPATPELMTRAQAEILGQLTQVASDAEIAVTEHRRLTDYTLRVSFARKGVTSCIDYTLDKHGRLKHVQPLTAHCPSPDLLRAVLTLTEGAHHGP